MPSFGVWKQRFSNKAHLSETAGASQKLKKGSLILPAIDGISTKSAAIGSPCRLCLFSSFSRIDLNFRHIRVALACFELPLCG